MSWIENIHKGIWNRIQRSTEVSDNSLAAFRIVFGFLVLLFFTFRFSWIGNMPDTLFDPPKISISAIFSSFPPTAYFKILETVFVLSVVCICLGIRARSASLIAGISYLLMSSFANSFGKIDHDVLFLAVFICMYFSNWGTKHAIVADRKTNYMLRGETLLAIFIAFGMFTAGFQKAFLWIDFNMAESGFLRWFYNSYFSLGRTHLLAEWVFNFPPILIELFDYFAVLLELTAIIALLYGRSSWRIWILIAAIFHIGNLLFLNISFSIHLLVYLPFVIHPLKKSVNIRGLTIISIILLMLNLYISWFIPETKSLIRLVLGNDLGDILKLYLILWILFIFYSIYSYRYSLKNT